MDKVENRLQVALGAGDDQSDADGTSLWTFANGGQYRCPPHYQDRNASGPSGQEPQPEINLSA